MVIITPVFACMHDFPSFSNLQPIPLYLPKSSPCTVVMAYKHSSVSSCDYSNTADAVTPVLPTSALL